MAHDLFDPGHPQSVRVREILIRRSIFDSPDKDRLLQAICGLVNTLQDYGAYTRQELPAELMQAYHVDYYDAQVQNGGHAQFIGNSNWNEDIVGDVERGIAAMQADDYLALFRSVRARVDADHALKASAVASRGFSDLGGGMVGDLNEHDERFFSLSRSRSLRDFMQDWLRTLDMVRLVPDREWLGELHSTIMANPLRQARLDSLGHGDRDFSGECLPRTELENQAYQQATELCVSAGCELVRVKSAGWAQGFGTLFSPRGTRRKSHRPFCWPADSHGCARY